MIQQALYSSASAGFLVAPVLVAVALFAGSRRRICWSRSSTSAYPNDLAGISRTKRSGGDKRRGRRWVNSTLLERPGQPIDIGGGDLPEGA